MTFRKVTLGTPAIEEVSYGGEILPTGVIQVRRCTIQKDAEGNIIGKVYHRYCVEPGEDYSNEPQEVKDVCSVEHTQAKIDARVVFHANRKG